MIVAVIALAALVVLFGITTLVYAVRSTPRKQPARVKTERGSVNVVRPNARSVEGLEIQYQHSGLVRSVRVGAMNCEHKELLLTMDDVAWRAMPNAQKQEVLAAARSTWAAKMCPGGPDIAYVVVKTDCGDVVGRASPRSVTIL